MSKVGLIFETINHEGRTHMAVQILPSRKEYQELLEEKDMGAIWVEAILKILQENSGAAHHFEGDPTNLQ